jgi:hypothetical protein
VKLLLNNSIRTSQETYYVSITTTNQLMLFKETTTVYCENDTKHIKTPRGQNYGLQKVGTSGVYAGQLPLLYGGQH